MEFEQNEEFSLRQVQGDLSLRILSLILIWRQKKNAIFFLPHQSHSERERVNERLRAIFSRPPGDEMEGIDKHSFSLI